MKLRDAIEIAAEGRAILFAGAGFSYGAKNISGTALSSESLKERLLSETDDKKYMNRDLQTVSGFYAVKKSKAELVRALQEVFTVREVKDYHVTVSSLSWKRIYTTNYDRVIETASEHSASGLSVRSVSLFDDYDSISKHNICVHINGYIEKINEKNLDDEIKLTDISYNSESLNGNQWFELFRSDLDSSSAIVIVGYSMQCDIDINRLLSSPSVRKKVVFIDSPKLDEIDRMRLEKYGECDLCGIEGLAEIIREVQSSFVPSPVSTKNFVSFSPQHEAFRKTEDENVSEASFNELLDFYAKGIFIDKMFRRDHTGMYKYMTGRIQCNKITEGIMSKNRGVYIILSDIGNGKTIFLEQLTDKLIQEVKNIRIFSFIHRYEGINDEIEYISGLPEKKVIIIDNYAGYIDILERFNSQLPREAKVFFILTARNSMHIKMEYKLLKALDIKRKDIMPVYLNQLSFQEAGVLADVIVSNQLKIADRNENIKGIITGECKSRMSAVVLEIFKSEKISSELTKLYDELKHEDKKLQNVIIFSLLNSVSNYGLNFNEILELFEADYVKLEENSNEFMTEIFSRSHDDDENITIKSSVIALHLLYRTIGFHAALDTMRTAFFAADKHKFSKNHEELMEGMLSHSNILNLMRHSETGERESDYALTENYYDSIRNTNFARNNPFFWEQFASACLDMKKFGTAEKCLENAEQAGKNQNSGFIPYHIRTIQGRYYLDKCIYGIQHKRIGIVEAVEAVRQATAAMLEHYYVPSFNNYYVFRELAKYPEIFDYIAEDIKPREASMYIESLSKMNAKLIERINSLTDYYSGKDKNELMRLHNNLQESMRKAQEKVSAGK